jgi:vitamin B12 transporter
VLAVRHRRSSGAAQHLALVSALMLTAVTRLHAQFPGELAGQVISASTREPIADADIEAAGSGIAVVSDAAGRFRLRGLPPGEWEISVTAIGYRPSRTSVTVGDGTVTQRVFALTPAVTKLAPLEVVADTPALDVGTSVLERADIEAHNAQDLPTVLAGQAGLTVTRYGGPGSPATVSIRGSAPHQVLVLLDGVPLNDVASGDVDLSAIPLEEIERVTIVRGAAAARYGPRALAGALILERRRASRTEASGSGTIGPWGERNGRASGSAVFRRGARELGVSTNAMLSRSTGDFEFAQDPVRGGGTARRENDDARTASLLLGFRAAFGGTFAELRGDALDLRRGVPGSIVQPSDLARQEERRAGVSLTAGHAAPLGDGWRADFQVGEDRVRYRDPSPPSSPPYHDSTTVSLVRAALSANRRLVGARWTAGAEARWLDLQSSTLVADAPSTVRVASGWLQVRSQRSIGGWMGGVTTDLRLDHDDQLDGARLSPAVGLYAGTDRLSLQLSWGMAYAPPTLGDRFFQPGVLAQPNPNLRAERVRGEVQGQLTLPNVRLGAVRASASASAFWADVDGMIIWSPDFRFVWSPDNYDVRRSGMEVSTTLTLPFAGLTFGGSLSHVAVEYRNAVLSGQVVYRPRLTASGTMGATVAGVELSSQYRYVGRRRTVPGSDLNTLEPFGTVDLQLSRRLSEQAGLTLTLGVDDVFDRSPAMLPDYPSAGRTWRISLSARTGEPTEPVRTAPNP